MSSVATVTVSVRARVSHRAAPPRGASTRAPAPSARAPVALRGPAAGRRGDREARRRERCAARGRALPRAFNAVCAAAEKKATQDPTTIVLGFSAARSSASALC